jgi:hypothetical protein
MNSHLIRPLILGVFAFPLFVAGQVSRTASISGVPAISGIPATESTTVYSDPGNNFFSNVPINELSAKAYRRFHRRFREVPTGEYWFKYAEGYQVSFTMDQHHEFAYFNPGGTFMYSLRYYGAGELSKDMREFVKRRFPDYTVDVVTEVNDGMKTFFMLQIMNPDHIKLVTISEGRVDVIKELTNGSANIGPAEAAR